MIDSQITSACFGKNTLENNIKVTGLFTEDNLYYYYRYCKIFLHKVILNVSNNDHQLC